MQGEEHLPLFSLLAPTNAPGAAQQLLCASSVTVFSGKNLGLTQEESILLGLLWLGVTKLGKSLVNQHTKERWFLLCCVFCVLGVKWTCVVWPFF